MLFVLLFELFEIEHRSNYMINNNRLLKYFTCLSKSYSCRAAWITFVRISCVLSIFVRANCLSLMALLRIVCWIYCWCLILSVNWFCKWIDEIKFVIISWELLRNIVKCDVSSDW